MISDPFLELSKDIQLDQGTTLCGWSEGVLLPVCFVKVPKHPCMRS